MAGKRARRRPRTDPPAAPPPEARDARAWLAPALVSAAVVACHANGLFGGLVFDADFIIGTDPRIRATSWANLVSILTGPYWYGQQTNLFRPLTTLSYWLNYSAMGLELRPFGYHATNVALHALNACLVLRLATRLGLPLLAAGFAALVFGLHPVTTEAVANVVGRADLLAATLTLGALLLHTRPAERGGSEAARALGIGALTGLALLSKEVGVVVPAAMLLYDVLLRATPSGGARLTWPRYAAVGVALAAVFAWRSAIFAGEYLAPPVFVDNPLVGAAPGVWQLTALQVFARYLLVLIAPLRLSADYSFDQVPLYGRGSALEDGAAWAGLVAALGLLAFAWTRRRKNPVLCFAIGFAFAAFLPVSNWIVRIGTIMAERLLYLPLAGVALALAAAAPRHSLRPVWIAAGVAWLAFLGARTIARNFDWATPETLFAATAEASPESCKTHAVLADLALERAQREGTLPRDIDAILARQQHAWSILQRAALPDRYYRVPVSLAKLHRLKADLPGTAPDARRDEIAAAAAAWQAAADIYRVQWQQERSRARAGSAEPVTGYAEPFVGLARTLAELERYDEAERAVEEALAVAPLDPAPLAIGASVAWRRGAPELASQRALERVLLEPGSKEAWNDLAALRRTQGGPDAVVATPEGPRLDVANERVRADLIAAFRDLVGRLRSGGHRALAEQVLAAGAAYGIPRDALDGA